VLVVPPPPPLPPPARASGAASPARARVAPAPAAPPAAPPLAPAGEEQEDLDDELPEVDFFLEQELLEEAGEALQRLLAFYPRDARLLERRATLARKAAPPAPPARVAAAAPRRAAAPPPAAPADESFDIARELAEELGTQPTGPAEDFQYSVEDVFDQFKKGVAQTVKAEDADTHYDLGIAYKEMGLLDDALHEFEVALSGKGRKKEIDCLTMIGVCRMEKGEPAAAVEAYQRALRSDHVTPEAARAIHYEIAAAFEASGDLLSALQFIQKVLKADPGYRDAQAIAARLASTPAAAPPGPKKNIGYV
jgi:pilus assembly protein FimV